MNVRISQNKAIPLSFFKYSEGLCILYETYVFDRRIQVVRNTERPCNTQLPWKFENKNYAFMI